MTSDEAVVAVIDLLERHNVPYMVVGSMSSNLYGIPRSTHDADIVLEVPSERMAAILAETPPPITVVPQLAFETITGTPKIELRVPDSQFKIELFWLSADPYDRERFDRRRRTNILGRAAYAPTAEDVVLQKLRWSKSGQRNRDVDDARNVLAVQGDALDWPYIHRWCDQHGTRALLDQIRRTIPPLE